VTNKTFALGNMYRIRYTGKRRETDQTYVADEEIVLVAVNDEDAFAKFPWVVDLAEFDEYAITSCEKQKGRCITVSHKERYVPHEEPDKNIKRELGTDQVWQRVFGDVDQTHKYVVVASTTCYAKNMLAAEEKMRRRLADGSATVRYTTEEVFSGDGFAKPKDQTIYPQARIIGLFSGRNR
jgi:hypothetical protein